MEEEYIILARRELKRAKTHAERFSPGGKYENKPERLRRQAIDEVKFQEERLLKMLHTGEYISIADPPTLGEVEAEKARKRARDAMFP